MATIADPNLKALARQWETIYQSAVFAGIVGDYAHQLRGGYHISIEDQPSSANYSVVRVDDASPPGNWPRNLAAALDESMSKADMVLSTRRFMAVWGDPTDPRGKYVNAYNGWTGTGDAKRYDFVRRTVSFATPDHKTHGHLDIRRRYVQDPMMVKAVISIARGETKEQWLLSTGAVIPKPVLKLGSTGPEVARLQSKLKLNYASYAGHLDVDGDFGKQTEEVVKEFQRRSHLKDDGVVGPLTRAALRL